MRKVVASHACPGCNGLYIPAVVGDSFAIMTATSPSQQIVPSYIGQEWMNVRRPSHGWRTTYKGCQRWEDPVGTDAWFGGSAYTYMPWEASRVLTQDNLSRLMLRSFSSSTRGFERPLGLRLLVPPAWPGEPPLGNTVWLRRQASSRVLGAPPRIISERRWTSQSNKTLEFRRGQSH